MPSRRAATVNYTTITSAAARQPIVREPSMLSDAVVVPKAATTAARRLRAPTLSTKDEFRVQLDRILTCWRAFEGSGVAVKWGAVARMELQGCDIEDRA